MTALEFVIDCCAAQARLRMACGYAENEGEMSVQEGTKTIMIYRHKPTLVDAAQWSPDKPHPAVQFPYIKQQLGEPDYIGKQCGWIRRGWKRGSSIEPGDWIVGKEEAGYYEMMKDEEFRRYYEADDGKLS